MVHSLTDVIVHVMVSKACLERAVVLWEPWLKCVKWQVLVKAAKSGMNSAQQTLQPARICIRSTAARVALVAASAQRKGRYGTPTGHYASKRLSVCITTTKINQVGD